MVDLVHYLAGFNGFDLLLWSVIGSGLIFSLIKGSEKMKDLLSAVFLLALVGAWGTHIITCLIQTKYLLLIAGAFIFPVGVIHGVGIWFGAGW